MASSSNIISFRTSPQEIEGHLVARLPKESSAALPSRGQVAVTGTIDGKSFSTVLEPDGEKGHWMDLGTVQPSRFTDIRRNSIPEDLEVNLRPVKEWPEPVVPADLQEALDKAPDVEEVWKSITPMARWEWVRWVNATKNLDTRARRVEVSISKMRGGKRRPCCFNLASCTDPELARSGKLIGI